MKKFGVFGTLLRVSLLLAVYQTHVTNNATADIVNAPDHICHVEEKVNVTQLDSTAPGGLSICLTLPQLCPKLYFDKYMKNLTVEKTIIVEKCCPGFVRSAENLTCVAVEEMQPTESNNGDWHQAHRRRTSLTMAKLIKLFAEKYGYNNEELDRDVFEFTPIERPEAKIYDSKQGDDLQGEAGPLSDDEETFRFKKAISLLLGRMVLIAGGLLSAGMVIFNIFLVIMTCNACRVQYSDDEIIDDLEEIARNSSKCVEWIEIPPANKPGPSGVAELCDNRPGSMNPEKTPKKKRIMSWSEIKTAILDALASCNVMGKTQSKTPKTDPELGIGKIPNGDCVRLTVPDLPLPCVTVSRRFTNALNDMVDFNSNNLHMCDAEAVYTGYETDETELEDDDEDVEEYEESGDDNQVMGRGPLPPIPTFFAPAQLKDVKIQVDNETVTDV